MNKINKIDNIMMETAINFASLSVAKRKQVGAVLTKNNRIIAVGYNGTLPGIDNNCEVESHCKRCGGKGNTLEFVRHDATSFGDYDNLKCEECNGTGKIIQTSEFVLHAEQNVLAFCNREGLSTKDTTLYITMAPCKTCSKLIAAAGIKEVFYYDKYRDSDGLGFLKKLNIKLNQIKGLEK